MSPIEGLRDFDFLHGCWRVHHRRLRERGTGAGDWQEFTGTAETRPLLGGLCNIEEHSIEAADVSGVAFRTFDLANRRWSIHWVSRLRGTLEPPVVGTFAGRVGWFKGEDLDRGRPVRIRFMWDRTDADAPRWEQSFSYDDGFSWELNWVMRFERDTALTFR